MKSALQPYFAKRDFKITSEPTGGTSAAGTLSFVVQKHAATRLHYDFRLELDGTLKSWAVPKGPSLDPADKRMAVHVEDHPLDYATFEGTIPKGQYGAGKVIVWDNGTWEPVGDPRAGYRDGKLKFRLHGHKLQGGWTLVRMHGRAGERQEPWLLIKERDDAARPSAEYQIVVAEPNSVLSDATIEDKPTASANEAAADDTAKQRGVRTTGETAAGKPAGSKPAASKTAAGKTVAGKTVAGKTAAGKAAASKAAASKAAGKTAASKTAAAKAPAAKSATTKSAHAKTAPSKNVTAKTAAATAEPAKTTDPNAIDAGQPAAGGAAKRARKTESDAATPALPAGAVKARLPATFLPQLATLVSEPPADDGWIYEIKFDGYRLLARVDGDDVRLFTRRGNDWSERMPGLVDAVRSLGIGPGWFDGEIVVNGSTGVPDFNALQNAFESSRVGDIQYYVFDLPYWNGHDLRNVPLVERRALLASLLDRAPQQERVRFSQDFDSRPEELLQNACRMRLEGMIGKRADAPYVSRRSPTWIKLKCTQRQEFVVGGWTDPQGTRTGIGSLLLGIHDEAGALRYAGGVGSGFDEKTLRAVKAALDAIPAARTPFVDKPREVRGHWVEPKLVAEVSFGEWTPDGRIRHSVFHGLRDDKDASAIVREQAKAPDDAQTPPTRASTSAKAVPSLSQAPAKRRAAAKTPTPKPNANTSTSTSTTEAAAAPAAPRARPARKAAKADDATVQGIRISHPDRVVDESTGITKLDVVNYYLEAAKLILPHLVRRPVSLVRAPAGLAGHLVFQRHAGALRIPELREVAAAFSPDHEPMVEVDSFTALIGAAQANVVEFHTWNATTKDALHPDRIVFDLDPGEGLAWKQMQEGAGLMQSLLEQLGLQSFLKTSGGKGLHVVVPLAPKEDWDTIKDLAKRIVEHMAATIPDRFVAKSGPKNRVGRIFVDYLRNGFGATTACAWSARARPGLGVSVPCTWGELGSLTSGAHWTIRNVHERMEEPSDPWRGYAQTRQSAAKAMRLIGLERVTA